MKILNGMPDMATINRYWGSLEAYQEEQRRTALINLEEAQADKASGFKWNWDFGGRRQRQSRRKGSHLA